MKLPELEPVAWLWKRTYQMGGYTSLVTKSEVQAQEWAQDGHNLKIPDKVYPLVTLSDAQQAIAEAYAQGKKDAISDIVSCHIASRAAPKQENLK